MSKKYYVNEDGCQVWVIENYITSEDEKELFTELQALPLIRFSLGKKFGKEWIQPRESMCLGYAYAYSGRVHPAVHWTPLAKNVCDLVNDEFGTNFNGAMVNCYRDGNDSVSAHSDDESTLDANSAVFGISTGSSCDMVMKWKDKRGPPIKFPLPPGSLFGMEGETQGKLSHEIPKRANRGKRISLTLRKFQPHICNAKCKKRVVCVPCNTVTTVRYCEYDINTPLPISVICEKCTGIITLSE